MTRTLHALATVLLVGFLGVFAPTPAQADTHQTVPSANFSFMSDLQNFLRVEDANRYADLFSSLVVSGGIHSTAAGLVGSPSALVAYLGGYYTTESGTITYPDASTCHVIAHKDTTANQGSYTRVSGTHYLINCASSIPPAIPNADSVLLMTVTTSGGAITAVLDRRPLGPSTGFDACRYATLTDAIAAYGSGPGTFTINCLLPVDQDVTTPAEAVIQFGVSGALSCATAGVDITVNGHIAAPSRRVFYLSNGCRVVPSPHTNSRIQAAWWGVLCDDASDNTTAFNAAIAASNSTTMLIPAGVCRFTALTATSLTGIRWIGAGRYATILKPTTATGNSITLTDVQLFSFSGFEISSTVQRTAGAFFYLDNSSQGIFEDIRMQSPFQGWVSTNGTTQIIWDKVWVLSQNNAWDWSSAWYAISSSSLMFSNITFGPGTASVIDAAISIDSGVDTVQLVNVVGGPNPNDFTTGGVGIRLAHSLSPSSFPPRWIRMTNCHVEGGQSPAIRIDDGLHVTITDGYAVTSQNGLLVTGGTDIQVRGGLYGNNGEHGIRLSAGSHILIDGATVSGNSRASTDTYSGISVADGADVVRLINNDITNTVFNTTIHHHGIALEATTNDRQVVGNKIADQGSEAIFDAATGIRRIHDNIGWTTEASGTGTINSGATTAVITHGLSVTPTAKNISITMTENPSNDIGLIWVSAITSTQFTVNVRADPGASNLDFSWHAMVR